MSQNKTFFRYKLPHLDPGTFWSTESESIFFNIGNRCDYAFENLLNSPNKVASIFPKFSWFYDSISLKL